MKEENLTLIGQDKANSKKFDNFLNLIYKKLFLGKLSGKMFAIKTFSIMGITVLFSTHFLTRFSVIENPYLSILGTSFFSILMPLWTLITIILYLSFMAKRLRDIIPDTSIAPYLLGAFLLGLIPLLNVVLYIFLAVIPSNYLNSNKRTELSNKFLN